MNLVTSSSAAITVSTCIVGLLLVLPRSNVRACARFVIFAIQQRFAVTGGLHVGGEPQVVDVDGANEQGSSNGESNKGDRELVNA